MWKWALCLLLTTGGLQLAAQANGRYLARIAGCVDCHSTQVDRPFAGGYRLATPFGSFYTPNITPDRITGIGSWTESEFRRALRYGLRPDGSIYFPAFPYWSYTNLTDEDVHSIFEYLRSIRPIRQADRAHDLHFPFDQRWLLNFWKLFFFHSGPYRPNPSRSLSWNRGAYLVKAALHCAECHTPRNFLGAPKMSLWMAGTMDPISGRVIPNITPDLQTGLGHWTAEDWSRFLSSGLRPDLSTPGAEMAQVLQNTSALTPNDRAAVVEYLMSMKPIHREVDHGR